MAVALVVADHDQHRVTVEALKGLRLGLAGHAAFETYSVLTRLPELRISGGSVYDALVGSAAVEHAIRLATRDLRALPTYRALGVDLEVLST